MPAGALTTYYAYDLLGRTVAVSYPAVGDVAAFTVSNQYDRLGHRVALTDTTGTTLWGYDGAYRVWTGDVAADGNGAVWL